MPELLLEILSEEIPARMQARAADDLKRLVADGLKDAGLDWDTAESWVTPRRLGLRVDGIPEKTPDVSEERRGPRTDAPEKAVQGFLGSVGLTLDQVEKRETPKGEFYFAVIEKKGEAIEGLIPKIVRSVVWSFPWAKSMRWGNESGLSWVRPIHQILCRFGGKTVGFDLGRPIGEADIGTDTIGSKPLHGIEAGNATRGHRFLAPEPIAVSGYADYRDKLRAAKVVIDPAERRALIAEHAEKRATAEGLTVRDDPGLLDEVAGLVEWVSADTVHLGRIDEQFMDLPPEVLTTSMRSHQKYFSCLDADGRLAPRFIVVAGTETRDGGAAVVAGNERVLRARLADARFFWDTDREQSLASRAPALRDRVFHARLGTLDEKADRMEALAVDVAGHVPGADKDRVRSAARLAKADLSTGMVGEFPELQGIMGRYYALNDGEHADVADAIAEHYSPVGPGDACPTKPVSVCVALADKIDTLVGFFGIGEKPTGSKDPFALRRAALGVIRLVTENGLRVPLADLFERAAALYDGTAEIACDTDELLAFFADRLKVHLREQGVRHDLIDAVFAVEKPGGGLEDDLVRLLARVEALRRFLETDDGANLLTAYKRAANILRIEEKKDKRTYDAEVAEDLLTLDEETRLHGELTTLGPQVAGAIGEERFADAMAALARVRPEVDAFFDHVTVNCDETALRENRLNMLSRIRRALAAVGDFSRIEG